MEEHLSIFDDIYDIKDNITDGQFLNLNNKIQKLIREYKDLRESLANSAWIVEVPQCGCTRRWTFPNLLASDAVPSDYFCLESLERMHNCENFQRLMEKLPLLENLFRKIDLPFVEEAIYEEYVKHEFTMIARILLFLAAEISGKRNKIIITFVMYDFIIRNANFLKDYPRYTNASCLKFEELLVDREYIPILSEFNINYAKWIDIMKSNIVSE